MGPRSPAPASQSGTSSTTAASNINPALANDGVGGPNASPNNPGGGSQASAADPQIPSLLAGIPLQHMDSAQILALLRHLPGVFNKLAGGDGGRDGPPVPGDSNLPHGPPPALNQTHNDDDPNDGDYHEPGKSQYSPQAGGKRRRGDLNTEEWLRLRKDNHKEVERRRRGNINEGINELARMVPNGAGDKAKGAILSRAVQYIHSLKENEARNIEKWTLEKLLMDQAMGDLQAQLQEMTKLWEQESSTSNKLQDRVNALESELHSLKADSGKDDNEGGDGNGAPKKRARAD